MDHSVLSRPCSIYHLSYGLRVQLILFIFILTPACQAWRQGVSPTHQDVMLYPPGLVVEIPMAWRFESLVIPATEQQPSATLTRIEPHQAQVPGSPRLDIYVPARGEREPLLEGLLTRTLQSMRDLETEGSIIIQHVHQEPRQISQLPAYLATHQFVVKATNQVISQQAMLLVYNGTEVTLTAAGTTELFAPLAPTMLKIMLTLHPVAMTQKPSSSKQ